MAALLAFLVACPFTAPFRVCKTPQARAGLMSHARQASRPSHTVHLQADAVPLSTPSSIADDPLKGDARLSESPLASVAIAHVTAAPRLTVSVDVPRPVVGALRL